MKTVEGAITAVSATVATATITASGTTERVKSNSISAVVAGSTKGLRMNVINQYALVA
jgi:CDP-diglyceride synthetase